MCDGQTDGRTDSPRYAYASRGKMKRVAAVVPEVEFSCNLA